jgi:hypothetical protein
MVSKRDKIGCCIVFFLLKIISIDWKPNIFKMSLSLHFYIKRTAWYWNTISKFEILCSEPIFLWFKSLHLTTLSEREKSTYKKVENIDYRHRAF